MCSSCGMYRNFTPIDCQIICGIDTPHFKKSIHQLMDIWVFFTFWRTWIMLLWTFVYTLLCGKSNNRQGLIGWGLGKCEWGESSEGKIESCLDLCCYQWGCHLSLGCWAAETWLFQTEIRCMYKACFQECEISQEFFKNLDYMLKPCYFGHVRLNRIYYQHSFHLCLFTFCNEATRGLFQWSNS